MRVSWALAGPLLLAAACGTGTDGKPVVPPTTPEPPLAPPTVRGLAQVLSVPGEPGGYYEGDHIRVLVDFEQRVSVEGSPRLGIEIGEHVRFAEFLTWWEDDWPPERASVGWRFDYQVGPDDEDADGIGIRSDAFDLSEGAFLTGAGIAVAVEIYAVTSDHVSREHVRVEPGESLASHAVVGRPAPRVCTDELEQARAYAHHAVLLDEWDGTPFRIYFDEAIPAYEHADAEHFFGVAERLADRIEEQVGYPIIELGGWLPLAERTFEIRDANLRDCERVRPGEIIVTTIPDDTSYRGAARPHCAAFFWTHGDIDTTRDATFAHELFHLFAFGHSPITHPHEVETYGGVPMSVRLTNSPLGPRDLGVTFDDVDALRCIFPHPDVAH